MMKYYPTRSYRLAVTMHLMIMLLTAISTVLTQDCDQYTTCAIGQPLINCSTVDVTSRQINVYILESVPANSVIHCLDDNLFFPNATVSYEPPPSALFREYFSIDSDGAIVVTQSLNFEDMRLTQFPNSETVRQITVIIRGLSGVRRSEAATLTINIVNVNEFPPQLVIDPVSLMLIEDEDTLPVVIILVSDGDETQDHDFTINGNGREEFVIVNDDFFPNLQMLRFRQGLRADRERHAMYYLTIIAVDNLEPVKFSNPVQVNITVKDINDNTPQFTNNRTFTIPTVLGAGEFVGQVSASDPDAGENGTITYSIVSVFSLDVQLPLNDWFDINSTTGILYTDTELTFVAEGIRSINVTIMAEDNGRVPMNSTAVYVIVFQHPPQFSSSTYAFSLMENIPAPVIVGNVTASFTDGDSVSFIYQVNSTRFTVDNMSGEIRTLVGLDRENMATETFTVMAVGVMDPRLVSSATVMINVLDQNDEIPQFDQEQYSFMITTGTRVAGIISATDNDVGNNAVVTFSITVNLVIPLSVSNIGNNRAEIIVVDQTRTGQYAFEVMATDVGGLQSTARVTVTIINPQPETDEENSTVIIAVVVTTVSIVVILNLLILLAVVFLCWRHHHNGSAVSNDVSKCCWPWGTKYTPSNIHEFQSEPIITISQL